MTVTDLLSPVFDAQKWALVPFHFWSLVFFVFGSMVGSFLNVCIHRMPRGESVVSPPSHCPHCGYAIPGYLNIPLVTWVMLQGKCRNCSAPIAARYFLVELLTAVMFLTCWLAFGQESVLGALVLSMVMAGLLVATFIDLEHLIIPDEITLGGMGVGVVCSLAVPWLHGAETWWRSGYLSLVGLALGVGVVYGILRLGKLMYGRHALDFTDEVSVVFTDGALVLPEESVPYEDLFYRPSDRIELEGTQVEMVDRCYTDVPVTVSQSLLRIGEDEFDPEPIEWMKVVTRKITVPREAMGLGDVKFMGAIGAFLGWQAVLFSLMLSAFIGAAVGMTLILCGKREWSSRLPYGPYIALAAGVWIFFGPTILDWWLGR